MTVNRSPRLSSRFQPLTEEEAQTQIDLIDAYVKAMTSILPWQTLSIINGVPILEHRFKINVDDPGGMRRALQEHDLTQYDIMGVRFGGEQQHVIITLIPKGAIALTSFIKGR